MPAGGKTGVTDLSDVDETCLQLMKKVIGHRTYELPGLLFRFTQKPINWQGRQWDAFPPVIQEP